MKEEYEELKLRTIVIEVADIITTSPGGSACENELPPIPAD